MNFNWNLIQCVWAGEISRNYKLQIKELSRKNPVALRPRSPRKDTPVGSLAPGDDVQISNLKEKLNFL